MRAVRVERSAGFTGACSMADAFDEYDGSLTASTASWSAAAVATDPVDA